MNKHHEGHQEVKMVLGAGFGLAWSWMWWCKRFSLPECYLMRSGCSGGPLTWGRGTTTATVSPFTAAPPGLARAQCQSGADVGQRKEKWVHLTAEAAMG